jgi:site-specific recombinase XerD
MMENNDTIVKNYIEHLRKLHYSENTSKIHAINKFRFFTQDKSFAKINMNDLQHFFIFLKVNYKYSDMYLSSLGTDLRRFFKYLELKGINDNLMYSLVIPANRKHDPHIPINILKERYRKFYPRAGTIA